MRRRVLLIDDCPMLRLGLRSTLEREFDIDVCGETRDGREAMTLMRRLRPDLVVMDVALQCGSGLSLVRRLRNQSQALSILVWSLLDETLFAERALRAGALGFISKRQPVDEVISALHRVLDGQVYLSEGIIEQVAAGLVGGRQNGDSPLTALSDRELEVFELLGHGLATARVAERLNLSVKTIETHRDKIKRKLGLGSSTELIRHAVHWALYPD